MLYALWEQISDTSTKKDSPPLQIFGKELRGGELSLPGNVSSQYISALLMIAPYMQNGLELTLTGKIVSTPYIEMTLEMMSHFGIETHRSNNTIRVLAGRYCPKQFQIEPDWSAASYWYEIAALAPEAEIFLPNLSNKKPSRRCPHSRTFRTSGCFQPVFSGRHKTKKIGQNHFIIRTGPIRATRLSPNPCRNLLFNRASVQIHRPANP